MKDIFDAKVMCSECDKEMEKFSFEKSGFLLRALKCPKCGDKIVHPTDIKNFEQYNNLRGRTYSVKLRIVGNSHAISIPKEIVDFINESNNRVSKHFSDVVRLCFEDFGKLSVNFMDDVEAKKKW